MLAVRFNDDTMIRFCVGAHKLEEVIAVKHDSSSSTSCNQSANTVNAVSDDSDSISSSTDVPPEYTKDEYKNRQSPPKCLRLQVLRLKILFYLICWDKSPAAAR